MERWSLTYKKLLLACTMLIWLLPAIQDKLHLIHEGDLRGDYRLENDTTFNFPAWFDGAYSIRKEKYLNDQFGMRNQFVRVKNQVYYSLFSIPCANDVVIGKEGFLYEEKYIKAYLGEDFVGEDLLNKRFNKLKFIQDTLKKLNKDLILLFAPGKASFYPEYIPEKYPNKRAKTNYAVSVMMAKEKGLNYIDYGELFRMKKATSKYPLYPKTGTHWSIYGINYALDSMNRYIENLRNIRIRRFSYDEVVISDSLRESDGDIEGALNLFWKLPCFEMAYPKISYEDSIGKKRLNLLSIADSYWMGFYFTFVPEKVYNYHAFWYYNNLIYDYYKTDQGKNPVTLDFKTEISKYDVICIMAAEVNTANMGWGFVEDAYTFFKYGENSLANPLFRAEMHTIIRNVYESESWFKSVKEKAWQNNLPLDSMIFLDAQWVYKQNHQ